ncbi:hypothetical protein [Desulfuromonas sp. AOP6]|uniref:hypothetical protein n=1 Tax=Desulfuromonas sp. AOP6 TaxID=1566351 RepID=UPI00128287A4|nr:hypothetical protein [Desulfuromonas sp. AOP6]BCA80766.1 hypothetical protein AOP6_2553 [Desulfuromonas sp. AOP6]
MKNQKRGFIGIILGLALLLLCGCGGGGSDPPPIPPDDTVNKDPLAGSEIDGLNLEQPGRPAVATDGTNFLVVSATTAADGTSTLIGTLVGALDDAPFIDTTYPDDWTIIANLQNNATSSRPAAIFNGTHYCVVFQDGGHIYAQLIDSTGTPRGTKKELSTGDGNFLPVMAYDDVHQQALIVWVKYMDDSVNYYDLYSALIKFDNFSWLIEPLGIESSLLGDQPGDQNEPTVAFDGINYLVLWRQWTDTSQDITIASDIYGARVEAANGTVIGGEFAVSTAAEGQSEPKLAFDDTTPVDPKYLAVWSDLRNATTGYDIYGTLISTTITPVVSNDFPINKSTVPIQNFPTVTWDGSNFFVAWANVDIINSNEINLANTGIFADFVTPDGIVNNPDNLGLHVSGQPAEAALYIYPVVSNYLATWVELTLDGQSILGTWAIFQ